MVAESTELKQTPLTDRHVALAGKLVPFAGYRMPVQYSSVIEEHIATRTAAGLFDVSHMGEFVFDGPQAATLLELVTPSRIAPLPVGKVIYTVLTTPQGTIVDDLLVYRLGPNRFMAVVNASNRGKDMAWLQMHAKGLAVALDDVSDQTALIAIQGPEARSICRAIATGFDPMQVKYYWLATGELAGVPVQASRTGYTGEMGFEIFVPALESGRVWDALMAAGRDAGLRACGLAARDTLRLEAGLPLYGNDIDETTTVLEAKLDFTIDWEKPAFVGREALLAERDRGTRRSRVGFELQQAGVPRQHNEVWKDGQQVGIVTSGSFSPTFEKGIGMAYVSTEQASVGNALEIDVRGRRMRAAIVPLPFYKRPVPNPK